MAMSFESMVRGAGSPSELLDVAGEVLFCTQQTFRLLPYMVL